MPGRQLPVTQLPQNEAGRLTYPPMQAQVQWGLSDLQTAYSTLLLPCQSMSGSQMSCTFLSEHQTKIKATAVATEAARGRYDEAEDGSNEREDEPEHEQPQRR